MTQQLKEILHTNNINPGSTKFVLSYAELTNLLNQVVGEAVLATLSAPIKHLQNTTYDQQLVEATQLSIVDAIRNHFEWTP